MSDALIGRTVFEARRNLDQEWPDVLRKLPDYLADRECEEREKFVGVASECLKKVVFERSGGELVEVKETILDPDKADAFLAWLDGAIALKSALPPDPLAVRIELGGDSVAFRRANEKLAALWSKLKKRVGCPPGAAIMGAIAQARLWPRGGKRSSLFPAYINSISQRHFAQIRLCSTRQWRLYGPVRKASSLQGRSKHD